MVGTPASSTAATGFRPAAMTNPQRPGAISTSSSGELGLTECADHELPGWLARLNAAEVLVERDSVPAALSATRAAVTHRQQATEEGLHGDARLQEYPIEGDAADGPHACHIEGHRMAAYTLTAVEDAHAAARRIARVEYRSHRVQHC